MHVHFVLHANDYSDEEYNFKQMRKQFVETVTKVADGSYEGDNEDQCARGLEYRSREGALKRKENKLQGLQAVLEEQDRQYAESIEDDEALRYVYVANTRHCADEARRLGMHDAEEAAIILKRNEKRSRSRKALARIGKSISWRRESRGQKAIDQRPTPRKHSVAAAAC
eukprot:CAMPEP_0116860966 /NCGR_PEP_ID=MMETSP0418-20121206/22745_1 /TAXON_ID=1158023 /ORGANISM="Astrosyne radiata, Strain 13vi08-1A" /LENGTH=168 /DNA_ID=CAMNT_0004495505 /DNA_START=56 /DNA_END=562 /DNA_ORIENTATION=+